MRLYPKRLHSIEELERERSRVLRESRQLDKEDLFSFPGTGKKKQGAKKGKQEDEESSVIESLAGMLTGGNPYIGVIIKLVQRRFFNRKTKTASTPGVEERNGIKHWLRVAGKEVIVGYIKWKAIELAYKGIKHIIAKPEDKSK